MILLGDLNEGSSGTDEYFRNAVLKLASRASSDGFDVLLIIAREFLR